jgi:hypothetical protein
VNPGDPYSLSGVLHRWRLLMPPGRRPRLGHGRRRVGPEGNRVPRPIGI